MASLQPMAWDSLDDDFMLEILDLLEDHEEEAVKTQNPPHFPLHPRHDLRRANHAICAR